MKSRAPCLLWPATRGRRRRSIPRTSQPCWRAWHKPNAANSQPTKRLRRHSAASIDEAPLHAARDERSCSYCRYIQERSPSAARSIRAAILDSLQNLLLFPEVGRLQTVEAVRKLVTRKYRCLVYYTTDRRPKRLSSSASSIPLGSMKTPDHLCARTRIRGETGGKQHHGEADPARRRRQ